MTEPSGAEAFAGTRRYVVRRELGTGAVGRVYEAWDGVRKTEVALKTLVTLSPRSLYRFKSEFRALADIRHENLASLHELAVEGDTWFIVMELVRGVGWGRWVRSGDPDLPLDRTTFLSQDGLPIDPDTTDADFKPGPASAPPDIERVRDAVLQLLRALDALHTHGKLHRDVKPSNVAVTPEGRVVLLDFGLVYDTDRAVSELSRIDKVVGTAAYMAPEQALGEAPSPAGDLYSVGVMLFHALTGRLPFEGGMVEMLSAKQVRDAPPPSELVEGLPVDLESLCVDLLQRPPEARPSAREALARLGAAGVGPVRPRTLLVGREDARQDLEDAWSRARNGRCTLVAVRGSAGIGKTALARSFLGGLKRFEEVWILRGRCHDRENVPFKAIDTLMDSVRRKLGRVSAEDRDALELGDFSALVTLFPTLAEVLPVAEGDEVLEGRVLRQAAREQGVALLRALARVRPVVIFLDDVQWGDTGSARFLLHWAEHLSRTRLLMVLSGRADGSFHGAVTQDRRWIRLEGRDLVLGALDDGAIRRLALGVLEGEGEAVDWVVRESQGHPGLALELAAAYAEEPFELGSLRFEDILRGRLDRLPRDAQQVLLVASLSDRPVPLGVVSSALDLADVESAAAGLVDRRLLRSRRVGATVLVEPIHPRISPVVLDRESPGARARLHLAVAEALREAGWGEPERLVEHYLAAGSHDRVGPVALQAAEDAVVALDYDKAIELYRTALAFVPSSERPTAQRALAEALALAGRGSEAADVFTELAESAEGLERIHVLRRAGEQALFTGHLDRGIRLFDEVLDALGLPAVRDPNPTRVRVTVQRFLASTRNLFRSPEVRATPEGLERIDACFALAIPLQLLDPTRAGYFHYRSLEGARQIDDRFRVARSRSLGLMMRAASASSRERWREELDSVRASVSTLHSPYATGFLALCEGMSAYLEGSFRSGLRVLSGAERTLAHVSAPFELTMARSFRVRCLVWCGRLPQALALREAYVADGLDRGNELLVRSVWGDVLSLIDLAHDRPEDVKRHVLEVMENWSGGRWPFQRLFALHAETLRLLYQQRPTAAFEVMGRIDALLPSLGRNVVTPLHMAALRGRVAIACLGTHPARRAVADSCIAELSASTHRLAAPYTHLLKGALALALGERSQGCTELETAALAFDRAELALHVAALRYTVAVERGDARAKAAAEGWLRHQGVVRPAALCSVFVPRLD